MTECSLFR